MKKLFCVKEVKSGKIYPIETPNGKKITYFEKKEAAKKWRNDLNKFQSQCPKQNLFYVAKGPDHIGKHGHFGPSRMRRKPKAEVAER